MFVLFATNEPLRVTRSYIRPPSDVAQRPPHVLIYGYPEIKLHPEGTLAIRMVLAETSGHEGGSIPLLAGVPGRKPPLRKITEELELYGIIEAPGWYPQMYPRR